MFKEIVDLTLTLDHGLKSFPSHPPVYLMDYVTHEFSAPRYQEPCEGFASKLIICSDHAGTHIDAPIHFIKNGKDISVVSIEKCIGRGWCIDFSEKSKEELISDEMIKDKIQRHGINIKKGDIVLIHAWKGKWGEEGFYDCQGLGISGAEYLKQLGVGLVGTDLPILDVVGDKRRPIHMMLLDSEILLIENLVNLEKLPNDKPFLFIGLPLKVSGCTGSPVRAVAVLDEGVVS